MHGICTEVWKRHYLIRRKEAAFRQQDSDVDFIVGGDLAQGLCNCVVLLLVQRIEFLLIVDGDGGHTAFVLDCYHGV